MPTKPRPDTSQLLMRNDCCRVILLNWRQKDLTVQCMDSLLAAGINENSIIIVDNASGDGSSELFEKKYPACAVLRNPVNNGFGAGNNLGIKYALSQKSEFIWLLNNDTIVNSDTLPGMLKQFDTDSRIGIVGSMVYFIDRPETIQNVGGGFFNFKRFYPKPCREYPPPGKLDYITGCSMLVRREVFEETGLFDENIFMYYEDIDFSVRAARAKWQFAVSPTSKVYHKWGGSSKGGDSPFAFTHCFIAGWYLAKKYSPGLSYTLIVGFLYDRILKALVRGQFKNLFFLIKTLVFDKRRNT